MFNDSYSDPYGAIMLWNWGCSWGRANLNSWWVPSNMYFSSLVGRGLDLPVWPLKWSHLHYVQTNMQIPLIFLWSPNRLNKRLSTLRLRPICHINALWPSFQQPWTWVKESQGSFLMKHVAIHPIAKGYFVLEFGSFRDQLEVVKKGLFPPWKFMVQFCIFKGLPFLTERSRRSFEFSSIYSLLEAFPRSHWGMIWARRNP